MKKIFTLIFTTLFLLQLHAQPTLQASIGIGSTAQRVKIYVKSNSTLKTSMSTFEFNIGVPSALNVAQPTIVSSSNSITWSISAPQLEGGYNNYYITSNTSPFVYNFTANTEYEVLEVEFPGHTIQPNEVSLVTLPDGGQTGLALYLASGTPQSDGSNLYYTRSGTTVNNQFSYDQIGNEPGTTTSTATVTLVSLPVKISAFAASVLNNVPTLTWTVQNQDATSGNCEIEMSQDGIHFSEVGSVQATGETSGTYVYADNNSGVEGTVYYRLKIVDKDGHFSYSDVKILQLGAGATAAAIFPNPVDASSKLVFNLGDVQNVGVAISNAAGKTVQKLQFDGLNGRNEKQLNFSGLPAGVYNVTIITRSGKQTLRVVKK